MLFSGNVMGSAKRDFVLDEDICEEIAGYSVEHYDETVGFANIEEAINYYFKVLKDCHNDWGM